jgi:F-type H+-transporting ATPase subunit b
MPSFLTPDFGLFFWMLIAFVIVFVILAKFGFPVIINMVEERKKYIDDSLRSAKEANEKLANIQAESDNILKEARTKQSEILRNANATRDNIISEAKDKAAAESARILKEARKQIEAEKERAKRENKEDIIDLSVKIAAKVLAKDLEEDAKQKEWINKLLEEASIKP